MKNLVVLAGALSLAACGGSEIDEPVEAQIEATDEDMAAIDGEAELPEDADAAE